MFDTQRVAFNRKKQIVNSYNSPFHQFIYTDLIDRLEPIEKDIKKTLVIAPIMDEILKNRLVEKFPNNKVSLITAENITDQYQKDFDLIIFPLGLHWINYVQGFLNKIIKALDSNGIFICNFPGTGSLKQLRYILMELETNYAKTHTPHISPFIQFEQVPPLLQQAGFAENIIDMEAIELKYDSPLSLMKALKCAGESNALECGIYYSITKKMYQNLTIPNVESFTDHINLITFLSSPTKQSIKLKSTHF